MVGGVATLLASVPLFFLATRQRDARAAAADGVIVVADENSNVVPLPLAMPVAGGTTPHELAAVWRRGHDRGAGHG